MSLPHPLRLSRRLTAAPTHAGPTRRGLLIGGVLYGVAGAAAASDDAARALQRGGVVVAFRHAHAPGTYDPPDFRLGDCRTQRNLNAAGRAQSRALGAWFAARGLAPEHVRSSPWCRCVDTATLAFGRAQTWAALGSPHNASAAQTDAALHALRHALADVSSRPGFEVWVTHMFLLSQLAGVNLAAGEGVVLRATAGGHIEVVARLQPA